MSEEGTVELKIERFSEFFRDETCYRLSAPTYIYGLSWKILTYPPTTYPGWPDLETMAFLVQCNECNEEDDDPNWSCQASVKFQIVSQKAGVDELVCQIDHEFSLGDDLGCEEPINCAKLLNPENGFIKDDIVILRAHVIAEMPQSAQMSKLLAFASLISDSSDGTLIVGTNKISIHKTHLSCFSEYFKTMFRSELKEGHEDEIELGEVGYVDMLQLLSVIYPFNAEITAKNIIPILKLADRFIMPAVLEQCKNVLRTSDLNGTQKLLLAQQYNFKDLQREFAQQCKTVADANKLKTEPEYKLLDRDTLFLILDSITS